MPSPARHKALIFGALCSLSRPFFFFPIAFDVQLYSLFFFRASASQSLGLRTPTTLTGSITLRWQAHCSLHQPERTPMPAPTRRRVPPARKVHRQRRRAPDKGKYYRVDSIKGVRHRAHKSNKIEFFVKWSGFPLSEGTWEPEAALTRCRGALRRFHIRWQKHGYPANSPNLSLADRLQAGYLAIYEYHGFLDSDTYKLLPECGLIPVPTPLVTH